MNNFNILIIEDELVIALRIQSILEQHNYTVVGIADDSPSTIEYIQDHTIHLIIADINIHGYLNGIETIKLIQESFNIPAIFLTSHQEDKFLQQASLVNFSGYIVKPFLEENLIREVKLAYHRSSSSVDKELIYLSDYTYDVNLQVIKKCDQEIPLGKIEKFLLHILIININKTVLNEQIDQLLWNDNPVNDVTRRHLLFRLRKKLPELKIETIKGTGYKLVT